MGNWEDSVKPTIYESQINVPYEWWAGETASQFFISIRDKMIILGAKCPDCKKVFVPPRKNCPQCYDPKTELIELKNEGTVITFSVSRRAARIRPEIPLIYALIKIDGADTSMVHWLKNVKPENVKTGMRVRAVFNEQRKGNILDISYFEPI